MQANPLGHIAFRYYFIFCTEEFGGTAAMQQLARRLQDWAASVYAVRLFGTPSTGRVGAESAERVF